MELHIDFRRKEVLLLLSDRRERLIPIRHLTAAKGMLATEKPDAIVVMLGLNDRVAMREPAGDKADARTTDKKKDVKVKPDAKPGDKAGDAELSPDDSADNSEAPPSGATERSARSADGNRSGISSLA